MINYNKIAIIGAGNGGRATAVYLKNRGFTVNLGFRTFEPIKTIYFTKQIRSKGRIENIFDIDLITPEYSELLPEDIGVIIFVLPANTHAEVTHKILPFLQNNQILLLTPGRTWGAIQVYNIIRKMRPELQIYVGETQTLPFTSRIIGDTGVEIIELKTEVQYCFYPEKFNHRVSTIMFKLFPHLVEVDDIRVTSLNNIGAMLHPVGLILNTGVISRQQDLQFYTEGMAKDVVKIVQAVDEERCAIMRKIGMKPITFPQWANMVYGIREKDYYQVFQRVRGYQGILAPKTMNMRYLTEDMPTGLVPLSSIGKQVGVPTPAMDALINLACIMLDIDFRSQGRTVEKVGVPRELLNCSPVESKSRMENQEIPDEPSKLVIEKPQSF